MAFQAPLSVHNISAATSEVWPLMQSALIAPWKAPQKLAARRAVALYPGHSTQNTAARVPVELTQQPALPECLRTVPMSAMLLRSSAPASSNDLSRNPLTRASASVLRQAGLFPRSHHSMSPPPRQYSTFTRLGLYTYGQQTAAHLVRPTQSRSLFGQSSSRNLLAHMEQTANNNPQSATAQNAFYQALLRANMSDIVVERYQTGRYASNAACEAAYMRALERLGQSEKGRALAESQNSEGKNGAFNNEQLQTIGQAVAAQSRGGNIAMARGKSGSTGSGAKESPLYVVVEESIGGTIFKWAKFLLYFGLACYFSLVLLTVVIETTGILKKVGGTQNNEAQPQHQTVRFSDVHGCDEAKEELQELVEFLKAPEKFSTLGGKLPKGVLLVGPPGTGKTLLARAVAGEAGVPFFFMSGSEFDEVYVGVGAKRVRDLFNAARAKAPAIVFIDELDAIGGKRNERDAAYAKQTLNQLLTDLDGFSQSSGVIFLAATNFPQLLDKALTRPGRFDRNVVVPLPDVRGRVAILNHHMKNVQIGTDVDSAVIARGTPGFSGAELENVINQAAVHASKNKAKKVSMIDFEWAKDKIMMGAERRSAVIQQKDKLMTAYHEGGHALVAMFTTGADPLYKATIMPRGQALGITFQLPEIDKVSQAKNELIAHIDICMGGKVAEELVYGADHVTSGASSDIQKATQIAYAMVTTMGMSEELGNVDLDSHYSRLSSETKLHIEREVRRLVEEGHERAKKLLTSKRKELDTLAKALVEYETLSKDEMERVLRGEVLSEKLTLSPGVPIKLPEKLIPSALRAGDAGANTTAAVADDPTRRPPSAGAGGATL